MKYLISCFIFLLSLPFLFAQEKDNSIIEIGVFYAENTSKKAVLRGKISNPITGDALIGATVATDGTNIGTTTNHNGNYGLILPTGEHTLIVQYIGMEEVRKKIKIYSDGVLNIGMNEAAYSLSEITVAANRSDKNVRDAKAGITQLNIKEIEALPTFLGEVDVVKSLLMLPGVSSVGEGASGFNVRGGQIDQNLVLQNGAQLFNAAHVLGFFSAFNPDVIEKFTLYKGNIPAQFGGRASSVLDVQIRDGDFEDFQMKGGLGIIAARAAVQGPIIKDKTSFLLGGRLSYSDWVLKLVKNDDIRNSNVSFYDANAMITHKFNNKHKLRLSYYGSDDSFEFSNDFGYSWASQIGSAKWNSLLSQNFSFSTELVAGKYQSNYFVPEGLDAFELDNGIRYYQAKQNFFYLLNEQHEFNAGFEGVVYDMLPENVQPNSPASIFVPKNIEREQAREMSLYINDEFSIGERFSFSVGVRYSFFQNIGPNDIRSYEDDLPISNFTVKDTISFLNNEVIQNYGGWEPRLSARIGIGENNSIKLSYNRLRQYIHLISNSTAPTPVDIWQVSNPFLKPQIADNFSIGYFHNFNENVWESSIDFFYKDIQNLIDYKDFATLLLNENLETELLSGQGRAYGVELQIKRIAGRWTGWLSYAWSRSLLKVDGDFPEERINDGKWYATSFDKPHNFTFIAKRKMRNSSSFSCNITYSSGRPITPLVSSFEVNNISVANYGDRNTTRIPAYLRADIAFTIGRKKKAKHADKRFNGDFTLSIYNLTFRRNAFSVYYQRQGNSFIPKAYRLAVLGTAFPSLTYNFRFK